MQHIIARAERAGSYFFTPSTVSFFNSRILNATLTQMDATGDVFRFVTSEKMDYADARTYTVRQVTFSREVDEHGPRERVDFDTVGEFRQYGSAAQARRHIRDGEVNALG